MIEWEFSSYTFDEGGNGIFEICAVTNDTIVGDRIEVRQVMYVNGSAIGTPFAVNAASVYIHMH